jgi:hypothetical protein
VSWSRRVAATAGSPDGGVFRVLLRTVVIARVACLTLVICLATAQAAAGSGWPIQRAPTPLGSTSSVLSGVSCTSRTFCTTVGYSQTNGADTVALVERWNGASWSIQPTPAPEGSSLSGVSCTSRTFCTAVGTDGTGLVAERWNGSRWSIQRIPTSPGITRMLTGVSCTSRRACVAVGFLNGTVPLAERWNGVRWWIQRTPKGGDLAGVSCASAIAGIAVGETTDYVASSSTFAERWNGRTWAIQPIPTPNGGSDVYDDSLSAVSCTSATVCVAVGSFVAQCDSCSSVAFSERWNRFSWSIMHTRNPGQFDNALNGVWCSSLTACVAVGQSYTGLLAERWNGTWAIQQIANPASSISGLPSCMYSGCATLNGVSCTSRTACIAVGSYGDLPSAALGAWVSNRFGGAVRGV